MTATSSPRRVAFLGLGLMGGGMARRLLGAGFALNVYNRTAEKAKAIVAEGARLADSPRDAAEGAEVIVSMVADDAAARDVWLGRRGALDGASAGTVVIESSTVTTEWIRELASAAHAKGCDVLDAPVTGSRAQAAAGELNFLVGGSEGALERARPVLGAMSKSIVHVGPTGSGSLLKLINNFMCGVQAASLAEALALIERTGLDRDVATQVLTNGAPGSPLVRTLLARMIARDYTPNFHLSLMEKDLGYSIQEASRQKIALETAQAARAAFQRSVAAGRGRQDLSAIVESLREGAPD
jgi:3-hydroxyisobutyrate dehydrogenase